MRFSIKKIKFLASVKYYINRRIRPVLVLY